jgi:deazaflavin-dependent oxidoreductase (nitroreductase family)
VEETELSELDFCYVTTTGRSSGRPHTIEIWFALRDARVYVLSGGGDASDWVRNIRVNPTVGLRIGDRDMICRGYVVEDIDEDALARRLVMEKYQPRYTGDLEEWRETALPVAFVLPQD